MELQELAGTGLTGFIASALAEVVNRGLGLQGKHAFAVFIGMAAGVFAVKVGADQGVWYLSQAWEWLYGLLGTVAAGTGIHRLWDRDKESA